MNPFDLVKDEWLGFVKLGAAAVAVVFCVLLWNGHNARQQQIGYDRAASEAAEQRSKDAAAQRLRELSNFQKKEREDEARAKLEEQLDIARAAARTADERLRNAGAEFSRRLDGITRAAAIEAARTAAALLGQCSEEYRAVASAADGHFADAEQCRAAWPD